MKYLLFFTFIILLSCNNKKEGPDVSGIDINVTVKRFEKDFFSMDTTNMDASLDNLNAIYPGFLQVYLQGVLGIENPDDVPEQARFFIRQGKGLYDSISRKYSNNEKFGPGFQKAFQHVKYYFPKYLVPDIITLIGPVDALAKFNDGLTPNFLRDEFLGISLQFYAGKNFSLYEQPEYVVNVAPRFRSIRFDEEYIIADAMKLVVDQIYPDSSAGSSLIEQMVEKGKQWYLLDHFLPDEPDSVKTGFSGGQLEWTEENEGNIWAQIIATENLFSIEPATIQTYLGEAPFTQTLPEQSPGNIGQWIGWQIVKKFAEKKGLALKEVLQTPAKKIFEEAGYRPK